MKYLKLRVGVLLAGFMLGFCSFILHPTVAPADSGACRNPTCATWTQCFPNGCSSPPGWDYRIIWAGEYAYCADCWIAKGCVVCCTDC